MKALTHLELVIMISIATEKLGLDDNKLNIKGDLYKVFVDVAQQAYEHGINCGKEE